MDSYAYSPSSSAPSSSSYSNSSTSLAQFPSQYPHEQRSVKPPPAYRSALHSVSKIPGKNIITKMPIAPMPPIPPKIYKVDPVDFRDVVQRLTAAPGSQPTRLQEVAPRPLGLPPQHRIPVTHSSFDGSTGAPSQPGFSMSPSSLAWCPSFRFSPRTLSSLEPSTVL